MRKRSITIFVLVAMLLPMVVGVRPIRAADDPVINEFVFNHTGTDTHEYVEIFAAPDTDYSDFTILQIEGDGTGAGVIDSVQTVGTTDSQGFWVTGFLNNVFENGTVTLLLVEGFTGGVGDGLDTDNDGVLDSEPWSRIVDDVAVHDGGAEDCTYASTVLIRGYDGNSNTVGGASRIPNGTDTDSVDDWVRNDFDGEGLPNFTGTPDPGEALNTPGATNELVPEAPPPPAVTIMEIQGDGLFSPYEGQTVTTYGVVTADFQDTAKRGFFLQDPIGDGDPATSDGIFVYDRWFPVDAGDEISITGEVGEYYDMTQISGVWDRITVLSKSNPLPDPVELTDLPNESMVDGRDFWEPQEGMLASIENAPVVAPTSPYGEFGVLAKDDAKPGSGFYPQTQQILIRNLGGDVVDYNPERIVVDDESLDAPIVVMPGDRVRSLVGAVDYTFGMYKLQPISYDLKTHNMPNLPASTRSGPKVDTLITTFNVENLFDLELNVPTAVDVIGQVGFDPGRQWGSGLTSTEDNTIRRKPSVCQGDADGTDPFDPSVEWDGFPNNTFDGLGFHSVTCGTADGLFFSEYVEGSSYNKALEIYNGTGAAVNLATEGYAVEIYFNGSDSPGQTISLVGTLADSDVYVLAHPSADSDILAVTDQISSGVLFNGDDAVVLRKGGKDDAGSTPTPEALETQLTKLALALEIELELPQILVAQEVENTAILQELGDRVNAATGTNYQAVSFETSDVRGIEVGFLWDDDRVDLLDAYQMSGPEVEAAFGPSSPSPGREPLVGVFEIEGREITIVGNHFKSKGGDDPLYGATWPPLRVTEVQRKMQARVVRDFVSAILDTDPGALVMVAGDLNDFQFGEPGEGDDHPVAILEGGVGEVSLTNLLNLEKEAERFTYIYDGNSQVLDHMLVSPAFYDLFAAVDILHFNASFPDGLGDDASTPLRASDHDPLEGRFNFK
jgi:predicted extracellular nuclease